MVQNETDVDAPPLAVLFDHHYRAWLNAGGKGGTDAFINSHSPEYAAYLEAANQLVKGYCN